MAAQIPPLTIGGTMLKESDDLDIFGVTFDYKMSFENKGRNLSWALRRLCRCIIGFEKLCLVSELVM